MLVWGGSCPLTAPFCPSDLPALGIESFCLLLSLEKAPWPNSIKQMFTEQLLPSGLVLGWE